MQSAVTVQAQTSGPVRRALTLRALAGARVRGQVPRARWTGAQRGSHAFWDALVYRHIRAYLGLSRCRFAISAAAPIAPELLAFMRGIGVDIREAWGMSETTGAATLQAAQGACLGRVGGPVAGVELRIAPDGELLLRGGIVFAGYYRNPQATGDALRDGWLHTGDVAHMFEDGTISITDRKKDIMINAAGKNLSPALIETTLKASPYIKEVVVIADQRPFVTALVQIDYDTTRLWAEGQGISYTTFRSLAENPRVVTLIEAEVARLNADLARVEQVKKLALLPKELDHDDGEVTATMKVRRAAIMATYAPLIAALYQS
jgi:long-chain acyl-CoA synthetase